MSNREPAAPLERMPTDTTTDSPPSPNRAVDGLFPALIDYINHPTRKKKHRLCVTLAAFASGAVIYCASILFNKYG
jgi:hypothetical protein